MKGDWPILLVYIGLPSFIVIIFILYQGFRIYGNYEVCSHRFKDMNIIACMLSDKTRVLP